MKVETERKVMDLRIEKYRMNSYNSYMNKNKGVKDKSQEFFLLEKIFDVE